MNPPPQVPYSPAPAPASAPKITFAPAPVPARASPPLPLPIISLESSEAPSTGLKIVTATPIAPTAPKWLVYKREEKGEIESLAMCFSRYEADKQLNSTLSLEKKRIQLLNSEDQKFRQLEPEAEMRESKIFSIRPKQNVQQKNVPNVWESLLTERKLGRVPRSFFRFSVKQIMESVTKLAEYGIMHLGQAASSDTSNASTDTLGETGALDEDDDEFKNALMGNEYVEFVKRSFEKYDATISKDEQLLNGFYHAVYSGPSVQYLDEKQLQDLSTWLIDFANKAPMPKETEIKAIDQKESKTVRKFASLEALSYFKFLAEFSAYRVDVMSIEFIPFLNLAGFLGHSNDNVFYQKWEQLRKDKGGRFFEREIPFVQPRPTQQNYSTTVGINKQVLDIHADYVKKFRADNTILLPIRQLLPYSYLNVIKIIYTKKQEKGKYLPRGIGVLVNSLLTSLTAQDHDDFLAWSSELMTASSRPDILNLLGRFYLNEHKYTNFAAGLLLMRAAAERGNPHAIFNMCTYDTGNKQWFIEFAKLDFDGSW